METQFCKDIAELKRLNSKLDKSLAKISRYIDEGEPSLAYSESYSMEAIAERLVNLARLTPIATGNRSALESVEDNILSANDVSIEYTSKGWFKLHIPCLLPRKEKGNASYIRATVQAAMKRYFSENRHEKFSSKSVLIFEHIYSKDREYRAYRDHDNIEINVIVDLIALYCLVDDSPMLCCHYYTSKVGDEDGTNVYIVPFEDFQDWLKSSSV